MEHDESEKFEELKKEVNGLRAELNQLNEQKEKWFEKKEKAKKEISEVIKQVRGFRGRRDSLTKQVRELKQKRAGLHAAIKTRVSELNKARENSPKNVKTANPHAITRQIEAMERKIETEAISFEKEKQLMKIIKHKKKEQDEAERKNWFWESVRAASKEASAARKDAESTHKAIQNIAKQSQEMHEQVIALSKKIDGLGNEEKQFFEQFIACKKKFSEANSRLKEKLREINESGKLISIKNEVNARRKRQKIEDLLKEKEQSVNEKLKSGKKITTEDLLVFQRE